MIRTRRRQAAASEADNFWPAFTDMMSTIVLILIFLVLIAFLTNIIVSKSLDAKKKELADLEAGLYATMTQLSETEANLELMQDELDRTMAEVQEGETRLKMSQEEIDKQKDIIAQSNRELGNLRDRLQGVAVLRLEVLDKVKTSMEKNLGKTNAQGEELVQISDTGNIVINEGLVFDTDSYKLKTGGQELLSKLSEAFETVLDDQSVRVYIDAINIQGHTDETGSAAYNRDLSSKRAATVVNFLMSSNPPLEEKYGEYFAASAYSEFRPLNDGQTEDAYAENRRIEISVTLKDGSIQNVINEYLKDSLDVFQEESGNN